MFQSEINYKRFVEHVTTHGEGICKASLLAQGEFRKDVSLRSLKKSVEAVEDLVRPLEGYMEEMVVLHSRESLLFKEHMALNWPENFQVRILTKFGVCMGGDYLLYTFPVIISCGPLTIHQVHDCYKKSNIQTDLS